MCFKWISLNFPWISYHFLGFRGSKPDDFGAGPDAFGALPSQPRISVAFGLSVACGLPAFRIFSAFRPVPFSLSVSRFFLSFGLSVFRLLSVVFFVGPTRGGAARNSRPGRRGQLGPAVF